VEALLAFVGDYWWLAFPLAGIAGGVSNSWARAAKRRHKRRLEVIRAKTELTAAKSAARAQSRVAAVAPAEPSPAAQLAELTEVHDGVTHRWLDYELDVAKLIAFPSMSDGREPLTAGFLRAKKVADRLRPAEGTTPTADQLAEYRRAVAEFEVAFDLAEREARRVRDSQFTEEERKRLATASRLLAVAVDEAATPPERQLAYRRVREELDGLIALSDEAVEVLEKQVAQELPPGS
jgi:hypothetical protein